MGVRSVWLCSFVFVAALLAALALLANTGVGARAQTPGAEAGVQTEGQSLKLANSFYYPY